MERGHSVVTELPAAFTPEYDLFIFNRMEHLRLQGSAWLNLYLINKLNRKILAQVSFHITGSKAISPLSAPFGSFLFSSRLSSHDLHEFVVQCEGELQKKGVKSISVTEPPLVYRVHAELLQTILFNLGYRVSKAELSSAIKVDSLHFEEKIESWEKRKLKQAKTKSAAYKAIPLTEFDKVYAFILKCHKQKGYQLSMTAEELKKTVETFRRDFLLFGVFIQNELVAASISIRVHPGILYNFYSGHLKKFDSISPVVLLIGGMYKFCSTHGIHLLDLGTSSLESQLNFNLLEFKFRMGAIPSMKLTFEKELT